MNISELPTNSIECPSETFNSQITRHGWTKKGHNLTIGRTPKFIWYRNAKVGTRTTLNTFDQAGIVYQMRQEFGIEYRPDNPSDYLKFAFVRNPWDRLVSGWLNKIAKPTKVGLKLYKNEDKSFESFVRHLEDQDLKKYNDHFRLQTQLVPLEKIDVLGRFESFEADLKGILKRLDLNADIDLEKKNATQNRKPYQEYYTPDLRARVTRLYQEDIETLGYSF